MMGEDHLRLLSAQHLAKCLQPHHASHHLACLDGGRRRIKETLQSKVKDVVQPYLNDDDKITPGSIHATIKNIHTDIVSEALSKITPNRVIGGRPPEVDKRESYLPRLTRTTLAQLRSGFCAGSASHHLTSARSAARLRTQRFIFSSAQPIGQVFRWTTSGVTPGRLPSSSLRSPLSLSSHLRGLLLLLHSDAFRVAGFHRIPPMTPSSRRRRFLHLHFSLLLRL